MAPPKPVTPLASVPEADAPEPHVPYWKYWRRRRVLLAVLMFVGFFNVYSLRLDVITRKESSTDLQWEFSWENMEDYYSNRNIAFYMGFLLTQIPGALLAVRYGGAIVFMIGLGGMPIITLMGPDLPKLFGDYEIYVLNCIIFFQGLFAGVIFPASYALWQHWAPPMERTRLVTSALSGGLCGVFFTKLVVQPLNLYLGSAFFFYVIGIAGIVWCVLWRYAVRKDPAHDPRISPEELTYIKESVGEKAIMVRYPWKQYLKCRSMWPIFFVHFACNWAQHTCMMLAPMPEFMRDMWYFGPSSLASISSLPFLTMGITMQASGHLADWLIINRKLSVGDVRKVLVCVPLLVHVYLVLTLSLDMTKDAVIPCLMFAMGMLGIAWAGFSVQFFDFAPRDACVLFGVSNTIATVANIFLSASAGFLNAEEWVVVLYTSNGIVLFAAVIFAVFGPDIETFPVPNKTLFGVGLTTANRNPNPTNVVVNWFETLTEVSPFEDKPSTRVNHNRNATNVINNRQTIVKNNANPTGVFNNVQTSGIHNANTTGVVDNWFAKLRQYLLFEEEPLSLKHNANATEVVENRYDTFKQVSLFDVEPSTSVDHNANPTGVVENWFHKLKQVSLFDEETASVKNNCDVANDLETLSGKLLLVDDDEDYVNKPLN